MAQPMALPILSRCCRRLRQSHRVSEANSSGARCPPPISINSSASPSTASLRTPPRTPQHANHPLPYPRVEATAGGGGGDDARKVLDVMLKPVRCNPVLVGDAGSDTVMMEAVPSIP
jgi:hypothetical protein